MKDTNALAELAERLEVEAKFAQESGRNGRLIYNASLIVAELAKVGKRRDTEFCSDYITDCVSAYELCREIAEEGDAK